jgi:hypothetical protein
MVTPKPPEVGPYKGDTLLMTGMLYENARGYVLLRPCSLDTTTWATSTPGAKMQDTMVSPMKMEDKHSD